MLCRIDRWKECQEASTRALKESETRTGEEQRQVRNRAYKYLARARLHLGELPDAEKAIAQSTALGGDSEELSEVKNTLVPARMFKALVEVTSQPELPLGTYHLAGRLKGMKPLIEVQLTNLDTEDKQFRVEVGIEGVTLRSSQTAILGKNDSKSLSFNPPLSPSFIASTIRAAQASQLSVKVTAIDASSERVVYDQTLPIELQPRDFLPLASFDGKDAEHSTRAFVGAWITPNAKAVDAFLAKAKSRAERATFSGMQSGTLAQVRASTRSCRPKGPRT